MSHRKNRPKSGRPPGRPAWSPERCATEHGVTLQHLIDEVENKRGPGLQSIDEIAFGTLHCDPETLRLYLERDPKSSFSVAFTRARFVRSGQLKAKASRIAGNDSHPRQSDMLKYLLSRPAIGGNEFRDTQALTGANGEAPRKITIRWGDPPKAERRGKTRKVREQGPEE